MKRRLCKIVCGLVTALLGAGLVALAFLAVGHVGTSWAPIDYWLVWFSVFASVLGLICLVVGMFATATSVSDLCG